MERLTVRLLGFAQEQHQRTLFEPAPKYAYSASLLCNRVQPLLRKLSECDIRQAVVLRLAEVISTLELMLPHATPVKDKVDSAKTFDGGNDAHMCRHMSADGYRAAMRRWPDEAATRLVASGGVLEGVPLWRQILADAMGLPVDLPDCIESTSRGVAVLILEGLGRTTPERPGVISTTLPTDFGMEAMRTAKARQDGLYNYHCLAGQLTSMGPVPW